jgi:hypothetical protein
MVIFHLDQSKETGFLYETTTAAEVTQVLEDIAAIHNGILRVRCLVGMMKDLIKLGPMGEDNERHDPPADAAVLERAIADAQTAVSPDRVKANDKLTPESITQELATLSGAVTIVFPQGLPPSEAVRRVFEGGDVQGEFDIQTCQLWWARKSLARGKLVKDYLGTNERVKAVAKLTDAKSGPPPKEVGLSQEAQVRLMSQLHRKAEELKRISTDDGVEYLDSEWADPNGLQKTFQGLGDVTWKPH